MAKGNSIIVTSNPQGIFVEGLVKSGVTFKPGMIAEPDYSVDEVGGRRTYQVYQPGADGEMPKGPYYLVREDQQRGRTTSDAYSSTSGTRLFLYVPRAGEEVNVLLLDIAGTADDITKGTKLIVDNATGKFIATTGTPESEPAVCLETVTDPTADTLVHALWTGH